MRSHERSDVVLFRSDIDTEEEAEICAQYIPTFRNRTQIPENSRVICRYSALPYYRELEEDLALFGCELVNTHAQHRYVADIENYYGDLAGLTPKTVFEYGKLPPGSYVVKGRTNSRKHQWSRLMFAPTREDVPRIVERVLDDSFIASQGLCVREYVPLVQFDTGINDLPITNEWRFFVYKQVILTCGYYWSNFPDLAPYHWPPLEAVELVHEAIRRVGEKVNFWVVDVAEKKEGGWIIIELNDGQMSGLSMVDPHRLYWPLGNFGL